MPTEAGNRELDAGVIKAARGKLMEIDRDTGGLISDRALAKVLKAALAALAPKGQAEPVGYMRPEDREHSNFWVSANQNAYYRDPVYASPSAPLQEWRTMETCPIADNLVVMGWGEYRERDGFSPAFMRYYKSVGGWSVNAMPFYPTHWMPLPDRPTGEASPRREAE